MAVGCVSRSPLSGTELDPELSSHFLEFRAWIRGQGDVTTQGNSYGNGYNPYGGNPYGNYGGNPYANYGGNPYGNAYGNPAYGNPDGGSAQARFCFYSSQEHREPLALILASTLLQF